jgi:DNA-binding response OmpR family regulator
VSHHILLVDHDEDFRSEFRDYLEEYRFTEASTGHAALEILSEPNDIDLIMVEVLLPTSSGADILRRIKAIDESMPVVVLTACSREAAVREGIEVHADDYLEKPADIGKTRLAIGALIGPPRRSVCWKRAMREPGSKWSSSFCGPTVKSGSRLKMLLLSWRSAQNT